MKAKLAYFAVLLGLVAIPYAQIIDAFFVADDYNILAIVARAETVREATGIAAKWEFFRPLTALTYWVTYLCFGMEPVAFHLFDLVCHACNAFLVAQLTWLCRPNRLGAAFGGACFALLPTNPECVTWIAGRFDVLCVTGTLISVTALLTHLRGAGRIPLITMIAGLGIALFAKDTGMIVPVFLLFLCATAGAFHPVASGRRTPVLVAVVLTSVGYLACRLYVLDGFGGYQSNGDSTHLQIRLGNAFGFLRDATRLLFAPGAVMLQSLFTLGVLSTLVIRGGKQTWKRVWPVLACVGIALGPAANTVILQVNTGENSRFLYLPAVFFCASLGVVLGRVAASQRRTAVTLGLALLVSYAFTATWVNSDWRRAGRQAATIVEQLREFAANQKYEHLFIHGLPDTAGGAFVFRNGFEAALELFVGKKPRFPPHGRITRAVWEQHASRRRAQPNEHPEVLLLRWDTVAERLVEP